MSVVRTVCQACHSECGLLAHVEDGRVVRLEGHPTAELLTREAWNAIERALPAHVSLERVGVRETPMGGAFLTRKPA